MSLLLSTRPSQLLRDSLAANWQAAEQTLVTIGAAGVKQKLHLLIVSIANLVGNITIRLYIDVNGTQRLIYPPNPLTWNVATDGPGVAVVNGTIGIHDAVRVTVQSDNVADNAQLVDFAYMWEAA